MSNPDSPGPGHNGGPPLEQRTSTAWAWTDASGEPRLTTWHPDERRARPLPGRDKHGLMRPARDYAFERWCARRPARSGEEA